ncbi:MAG: DUF6702 family protein [Pseudomonadota bacterium]
MRHLSRALSLVLLAALFMGAAFAHKQKAAITEISFNLRSGTVEIAHRFIIHDAEHAISEVAGERRDLINDPEAQSLFADYVASHFDLSINGKLAQADLLGAEIDGGHIWIYQEAPAPIFVTRMALNQSALTEVWSGQINTVNVRTGGTVQTVSFSSDAGLKSLQLDPARVWAG